ncbi:MAG: GT4 family glycosyltransferase PelF, partial [Burkholderiaceae bacterium]
MTDDLPKAEKVDVMLLLEGTFPYVSGGVSSWVNQVIRGFPELTFGAVFLGSRADDYGDMRYELPDNFVHLQVHHMHDAKAPPAVGAIKGNKKAFSTNASLHDALKASREGANPLEATAEAGRLLAQIIPMLGEGGALSEDAFMYSKRSWEYVTENYYEFCTDPSFVDYFWTVRIMHSPIWMLMDITEDLIPANCYHTISTGYAGFLGALLKHKTGKPLILSEHGIYTKERKIDLFQSTWIRDNRGMFEKDPSQLGYFRNMWVRFFEAMGRMCYDASDKIVALYETNRLRQIADGAPPDRTLNVANGINLPRLAALRDKRETAPDGGPPKTLCLIGRVVPIKDIKTFIRAMKSVCEKIPEAEAWIAGPEDEDPAYALECRSIAISLGLEDRVKFLGFQKIDELLPKVGIGVLSSISEALPLVLLEGFAAGVPAVATDVGSCRQLIFGLGEEDQALGACGDIVRIADPEALAQACIKLLADPENWKAAQTAGIKRVEKYYTQEMMFAKYRDIYDWAIETGLSIKPPEPSLLKRIAQSACPHLGLAKKKRRANASTPAPVAPQP